MTNTPAATHENTDRSTPLPLRGDTFLGVCEGLGEEFGFNANWARLALSLLLFFNPVGVILAYLALGAVMAVTRWLFPPVRATTVTTSQPAPQPSNSDSEEKLAA